MGVTGPDGKPVELTFQPLIRFFFTVPDFDHIHNSLDPKTWVFIKKHRAWNVISEQYKEQSALFSALKSFGKTEKPLAQ